MIITRILLLPALLLSLIVSVREVRAATVELDDGRKLDVEILSQNDFSYTVLVDGVHVQLPRSRIVGVSEEAPARSEKNALSALSPSPDAPMVMQGEATRGPGEEAAANEANQPISVTNESTPGRSPEYGPEPEPQNIPHVRLPLPDNEDALNRLTNAIDALNMNSLPDAVAAARNTITNAGDQGLAMLATYGLYNDVPSVRTQSVELLASQGGRHVLKYLIEAFYSAARPTLPTYQVLYVRALANVISDLTGQNFRFFAERSARAPQIAQQMIEWWRANTDRVDPQLGEPKLDPTSPTYMADLRHLRELKLEVREFGGVVFPPNLVYPPFPPTAAEVELLNSVPVIPRDLELDRQIPTSYEMPSLREPPPARDAPGAFRTQQYLEKLLTR